MRGQMHHLDLTVSELARSRPFYELVLGFLGYRCVKDTDEVVVWDLTLPDGVCGIAIRPALRPRTHDRYTVGLHHFAWNADNRGDVDRLHDKLAAAGDDPRRAGGLSAIRRRLLRRILRRSRRPQARIRPYTGTSP